MILWLFGRKLLVAESSQIINIEKEMGYSRLEFFAQFELFSRHFPQNLRTKTTADKITLQSGVELKLIISLTELADRIIGSLVLPRLLVQFQFYNYSYEQQKEFIKKFDRSFQKGGG